MIHLMSRTILRLNAVDDGGCSELTELGTLALTLVA